jgi:dephospho-CoA kinase
LHFALGNLFRRRGEYERAVRVHQHLLSRGDLSQADLDRAQHALALDFLKAGLLDRAEDSLSKLEGTAFAEQAQLALDQGARVLVFDIPLLVESGRWRSQVDGVMVIDCSTDTQIARVQARNGWPREQILAVIQAQATRAQRQAAADWLILNDGLALDAFEDAVAQVARQWGLPAPAPVSL